jgi:hypothetical protein
MPKNPSLDTLHLNLGSATTTQQRSHHTLAPSASLLCCCPQLRASLHTTHTRGRHILYHECCAVYSCGAEGTPLTGMSDENVLKWYRHGEKAAGIGLKCQLCGKRCVALSSCCRAGAMIACCCRLLLLAGLGTCLSCADALEHLCARPHSAPLDTFCQLPHLP